jgi:hypothetical protein
MRVKVHPHKTMVNAGVEACVSITPMKKHGRAYYMGTVFLDDVSFVIHESGVKRAQAEQVRNVHAWAVGTLADESTLQMDIHKTCRRYMTKVTYHYNTGRFIEMLPPGFIGPPRDMTDKTFKAAVFIGRDFYVTKD